MTEINNDSYIKVLEISYNDVKGPAEKILEPSWEQVLQVLGEFNSSKVGRIQLSNPDLNISMIIHGQPEVYHIGICEKETDFYYYWNGAEPDGETVDVAWNAFDSHQICRDSSILLEIVKYFYETGKPWENALWENERLD